MYILEKHGGRLPLRIKAVPEGTVVPYKNGESELSLLKILDVLTTYNVRTPLYNRILYSLNSSCDSHVSQITCPLRWCLTFIEVVKYPLSPVVGSSMLILHMAGSMILYVHVEPL